MKVFVIGAGGLIGGAIARHLAKSGYTVSGLIRPGNESSQSKLNEEGISVYEGDLLLTLKDIIAEAVNYDAVVFSPQIHPDLEKEVVTSFLKAIEGSGKSFIFASGIGVSLQRTNGDWSEDSFAEDDEFTPEPLAIDRVATESLVRESAGKGIRGIVVRPSMIWGPNAHGHIENIYKSVQKTGFACYIGSGLAVYSNVFIDDLAELFKLVIEKGQSGSLYHGVGGEVPNRWIADTIAKLLGCETKSLTLGEAAEVWDEFGALLLSASNRSRSPRSRNELGWTPQKTDMLAYVDTIFRNGIPSVTEVSS